MLLLKSKDSNINNKEPPKSSKKKGKEPMKNNIIEDKDDQVVTISDNDGPFQLKVNKSILDESSMNYYFVYYLG